MADTLHDRCVDNRYIDSIINAINALMLNGQILGLGANWLLIAELPIYMMNHDDLFFVDRPSDVN